MPLWPTCCIKHEGLLFIVLLDSWEPIGRSNGLPLVPKLYLLIKFHNARTQTFRLAVIDNIRPSFLLSYPCPCSHYLLLRKLPQHIVAVLVICCYITNYSELCALKQQHVLSRRFCGCSIWIDVSVPCLA